MFDFTIKDRVITLGISIVIIFIILGILSTCMNVDEDIIYLPICGAAIYQVVDHLVYKYIHIGDKK